MVVLAIMDYRLFLYWKDRNIFFIASKFYFGRFINLRPINCTYKLHTVVNIISLNSKSNIKILVIKLIIVLLNCAGLVSILTGWIALEGPLHFERISP